jgi:predicted ferric reductase
MPSVLVTSAFASNPLWYTTRGTAVVAFVLLTIGTVLGVAATQRNLASRSWPRFATQALHRNVNVLALVFIVAHVVTTLLDAYVSVRLLSVVVPFTSSYRTLAVTCGAVAFDLVAIVAVTGFLRIRMTEPVWRFIHMTAYAAWPLAMLHFIFTGTDGSFGLWGFWLAVVAALAVLAAAWLRVVGPRDPRGPVRSVTGDR